MTPYRDMPAQPRQETWWERMVRLADQDTRDEEQEAFREFDRISNTGPRCGLQISTSFRRSMEVAGFFFHGDTCAAMWIRCGP